MLPSPPRATPRIISPSWFGTTTPHLLAGDAFFNEEVRAHGKVDGVSANEHISRATLDAIRLFAKDRPMYICQLADPGSAVRLANRRTVADRAQVV